jgi:predicted metal-dependent enzyme (double-stranded beta helix superfamily)
MTDIIKIKTIEELFNNINANMTLENIDNIIKNYNGDEWKKLVIFNEDKYCKRVLFSNDICEIIIIGWYPKQNAPKHDHAELGCSLLILQGELTENVYDILGEKLIQTNILKKGINNSINNDIGIHSIINNSNFDTVSLHVYRPPNHKTKYY